MNWLLGLFTGGWSIIAKGILGVFGNSILQPILQHLDASTAANKDTAIAMVQAEIAANQAKAAIAPAFKGLVYGIGIPPAVHFGATCISHTFALGWPVTPLPAEYVPVESVILTAFFVSSPLTTLARAGAARLLKA
ncbi:hypothetical protein [Methylobacterium gnaphalii]|uniref:Uncharacterized protein n=1 Tax=Methylobacterium gnaphalii TaxID=1010610 RepID=A0A512JIK6_9HYPH|nr:hypothetical protein [Methylobacterium gnaphalii]GEP09790.1 hypothetical protein MGN01_16350 [Methylobacterium gnaphalii]GJD67295.1 hypothetical protein MMMDOFMJ_0209 [Methylobacterium gnaphalii]GLS49820.1 hypothetical protein GCM10007885_26720 [Methylobacterium gnaphalii]